jgi:hypothetical protein
VITVLGIEGIFYPENEDMLTHFVESVPGLKAQQTIALCDLLFK